MNILYQGNILIDDVVITQAAEHEEELMKSDFVRLSWDSATGDVLPVDAYIEPFDDGVQYRLFEPYKPEQKSEDTYHYEPQFQHPKMYLSKVPFVKDSYDTERNPITLMEWSYTGFIGTLLEYFCNAINAAFGFTDEDVIEYLMVGEFENIVSTTFTAQDILSALSNVANLLECEWHIDWHERTLYFGHIQIDRQELEEPVLEVDSNIGVPSIRNSKEGYWNAYQPQGSNRNITVRAASGENVQANVRLALNKTQYPDGIIYTDGEGHILTKAQFEALGLTPYIKSVIYENVYPKLDLFVYDVRYRERYLLDDDGNKVIDHYEGSTPVYKRYAVWFMRLAYPTYNQQGEVTGWTDYTIDPETQVIDGKVLMGAFQANTRENAETSPLAGQGDGDGEHYGFELAYHETGEIIPPGSDGEGDTGVTIKAGDYEIILQQKDDFIIPSTPDVGMIPKGKTTQSLLGNVVNLYNIVMSDDYLVSAQNELENETLKTIAHDTEDNNTYTFKALETAFEQSNPNLYIGRKVTYRNGSYELETRVMKLVTKLDYSFDQEITIGNEVLKGNQTTMREKVDSLITAFAQGNGGMSETQIKRLISNWVTPRFLSKLNNDTAQGFIRFMQGLQVGSQFVSGILGEGGVFRKDADGKTYIEADKMYVRMKAYFDSVEIREYQHTSGNRIASQAKGFTASRVEWLDASGNVTDNINNAVKFRCYWRAKDDEHETQNQFVVGDQAFMEYSDVVDGNLVQKRFWRVVVGRNVSLTEDGEAWIDLSNKANDTITYIDHQGTSRTQGVTGFEPNSSIPQPEDDICQLGNVWDTERQGAIIEYVSGGDAPSYQIFQGIDSFSLNGKNMVGLGYSSLTGKAYMNVYGDAYIGDPQGSTYVKYEQRNSATLAPKLTIKADMDIQSTFGGQTLEERVVEYAPPFDDTEIWAEMANLQDQIDGAIETYYMTGEPSLSLPPVISTQAHPYDNPWLDGTETPAERTKILNNHVGDLYYDKATGRGYRFMYDDENQVFLWTELSDADVAEALRVANDAKDTADGKRTVYSTWGAWIKSGVNTLEVGDLFIPASDTTQGGVTYKAKKVYKCTTEGTNAFEEINYTDDSALNTFKLNQYVQQLINGTISSDITTAQNTASGAATAAAAAQGTADSAAAAAAALGYLSQALGQDTAISGGLVLSTLIGLRDGNGQLWSGINGAYQAAETGTGYKGHGIAAWYGGAMVDKEVVTTATDYAKSLFRFDGSGYLASGNITWDKNGIVTIANVYSDVNGQPVPWSGATLQYITNLSTLLPITIQSGTTYLDPKVGFKQLSILGKSVATQEWVGQNYVSVAFFERLFQAYNGTTKVNTNSTSTIDNIKAMFGFWTEKYISALGKNDSGSSGGIDMTTVWSALAGNTNEQINASHLTTALSGYATTSWVNQNFALKSDIPTLATLSWSGYSSGSYNGSEAKTISIPNNTNQLTNGAGFITSSALSSYLPLSGGTMTGSINWGGATREILSFAPSVNSWKGGLKYSWASKTTIALWSINSMAQFVWNAGANASSTDIDGWTTRTYDFQVGRNSSNVLEAKVGGNVIWHAGNLTKVSQLTNDSGYVTSSGVTSVATGTGLTGGTITGTGTISIDSTYQTYISNGNTAYGYFTDGVANKSACLSTSDSIQSQDTLDGFNEARKLKYGIWNGFTPTGLYGNGIIIDGGYTSATYGFQIAIDDDPTYKIHLRQRGGNGWADWKQIPMGDGTGASGTWGISISGNAATATKLTTARTIWGQSFDGSGNVSGAISGATNLFVINDSSSSTYDAMVYFRNYSNEDWAVKIDCSTYNYGLYIKATNNALYVDGKTILLGATSLSSTLSVTGAATLSSTLGVTGLLTASGGINIPSGKTLTIGDAVLSWDSTNQAVKITKGLYSETFISALGANSSGGSGGGADMETVWSALANNTSEQINASHLTTALSGYATQSWVYQQLTGGTVTAVKVGTTTYSPTDGVVSLPAYPTVPTNVSAFTNDAGYTTNIGTVTQVKVGTTAYNPSSGVVSLPAYPTTLPASDVSAWAKAASKPSYTHNEIGAGDLTIGNGANRIYLRTDGNWATAIYHQTNADEAVVFLNKGLNTGGTANYTTSWIFAYGNPSDRPAWNTLTPALQIKGQCVAINKLIGSRVGGSYNLDVNGSANATTLYENGNRVITSDNIGSQSVSYASSAGSVAWTNVSDRPTNVSSFTNDSGYITSSGSCSYTNYLKCYYSNAFHTENRIYAYWDSSKNRYQLKEETNNYTVYVEKSGYADSAGSVVWENVSNKPYEFGAKTVNANSAGWYRIAETTGSSSYAMIGSYGTFNVCDTGTGNPSVVKLEAFVEIGSVDLVQVGGIGYNNNQFITKARICYVTTWSSKLKAYLEVYSSDGRQNGIWIDYIGRGWTMLTPTKVDNDPTDGRTSYTIDLRKRGIVSESFYGSFVGNASTATTLQTSRTLWGQSFDGTGNVSGDMSSVGDIYFSASGKNIGGFMYFDTTNSRIGIGLSSPAYNLAVNGTFYASGDSSIGGTLGVTGNVTANAYEGKYLMSSNVVYIGKASDVVGSTGGCFYAYGKNPLYFYTNANNRMIITGSGDIGIGTTSPSYKLDVSGVIRSTTGIFSDGYVSALGQNTSSDIRKKDIKENIALSVEDIAAAPMIKYEWKDNRDLGLQVGSIAQYWESVLPESIHDDKDGFKSMQYGVIALLASISTARKVQDHERRIKELEKECERLRFENEQLRLS